MNRHHVVGWRSYAFAALCAAAGLAAFLHVRVTAPIQGLGNHDTAGIAYNADLILRGGLPYVDTVELKSPAAFFVVAAAFRAFGRSAEVLHRICEIGFVLGAVAVWVAAGVVYRGSGRPTAVRCAGAAVGLYWLSLAQFDSNYGSWVVPAYAWSFAACMIALHRPGVAWHLACGAFATVACLFKINAVVLAALVPACWLWGRRRGLPGAHVQAWWAWVLGSTAAVLPLAIPYARRHALLDLVVGVLPFREAVRYGDARRLDIGPWDLLSGLWRHLDGLFPLPLALSATAIVVVVSSTFVALAARRWRSASELDVAIVPLVAFVIASVVGGGLGGLRYYPHYAPQYVPSLALLAAHPAAWRCVARLRAPPRRARELVLAAVAALGLAWCGRVGFVAARRIVDGEVKSGFRPGRGPEHAGAYVLARTGPDDRIFCWGWRSWGVYFWADRQAPTGLYKELGALTDFNHNGMFGSKRRGRPRIEFREGPLADALLTEFRERPPAYVVRSKPFFPGVKNDPMTQFEPLNELLKRQYVKVEHFGYLDVYARKDLPDAEEHRRTSKSKAKRKRGKKR